MDGLWGAWLFSGKDGWAGIDDGYIYIWIGAEKGEGGGKNNAC